jgi:hypothetical protein
MHDIETHARWAILEWLIGQEMFARSVLKRNAGNFRHKRAAGILLFTRMMRLGLARYEEPATRRMEILRQLLADWKNAHPQQPQPPRKMLFQFGAEASRRAFRESYPALARFSDEIATMRREMEAASEAENLTARRIGMYPR